MILSSMVNYSPIAMLKAAWINRRLIVRLTVREFQARYRGSIFGLTWAVISPLILLAVYTFIFSVVFKARWDVPISSHGGFALMLFAGLIVFNIFSECITRAPHLILSNVSYVKKVIFPLEILPIVSMMSALINAAISFVVFLLFYLIFQGLPPLSAIFTPLVALPLIVSTLGLSWFLASVGLFIRDLQHVLGLLLLICMFVSPLFYPLSALPPDFQLLVQLNPLTIAIEQVRTLLFGFNQFNAMSFSIYFVISLLVAWLGFVWFMITRRGFADVV